MAGGALLEEGRIEDHGEVVGSAAWSILTASCFSTSWVVRLHALCFLARA